MVLKTVNQLIHDHPAFTPGGLRWDIFNARTNGLAAKGAILRKGRRVYLIEELYFDWLRDQNGKAA